MATFKISGGDKSTLGCAVLLIVGLAATLGATGVGWWFVSGTVA